MIKNIIFDMGNVLSVYQPQKYVNQIISDPGAAEAVYHELFLGPEWKQLDEGTISEEDAVAQVQARIPRYAEQVRRAMENWHCMMIPMPGMTELVAELKRKGYPLYLLSNASLRFFKYYRNVAVFRYFDGFVISAKEKLVKPNPAIYRCLLERFRLKAAECLFIDDLQENIDGAARVGIPGHRFQGAEELEKHFRKSGILEPCGK